MGSHSRRPAPGAPLAKGPNESLNREGLSVPRHLDDESEYTELDKQGDILQSDRRFVIGRNLKEQSNTKKFKAQELGLEGDTEFLVAKSINRFRVKGTGSRYVHGGTTLQEVVLPVIAFSKKRVSDISLVEVDLIRTTSTITSGQATFSFYQDSPVEEKVLPFGCLLWL